MGLIKALTGSVGSTLADQWKEYFCCDSLDSDTLVVRGRKVTGSRSSNTKGSDNVISNGSGIVVADGQCMIIVDQGKVVELCAEPGQFTWDKSSEPSVFCGKLGTALKESFKTIGRRIGFGGDTAKDQRVYYFNIKEIMDNKFGTANPVLFRVVDNKIGLDIDVSVRCSGVYSYRISDPMVFYTKVCGNITNAYTRDNLDNQLKTEFISALQPAFGKLSQLELRPNQIPSHTTELENAINDALSRKWTENRGLSVATVAISSLTLPEEDQEAIRAAQKSAFYSNPAYAAGSLAGATAEAMKTAAGNSNGAMAGFMGMGMTMNNGMSVINGMYAQAAQNQANQNKNKAEMPSKSQNSKSDSWTCKCGTVNTGKFCEECGAKKPETGWTCKCGAVNKGKFCMECGAKKPAGAPLYRCDKCGWEPADPSKPPKFCPECGDIFDDSDIK